MKKEIMRKIFSVVMAAVMFLGISAPGFGAPVALAVESVEAALGAGALHVAEWASEISLEIGEFLEDGKITDGRINPKLEAITWSSEENGPMNILERETPLGVPRTVPETFMYRGDEAFVQGFVTERSLLAEHKLSRIREMGIELKGGKQIEVKNGQQIEIKSSQQMESQGGQQMQSQGSQQMEGRGALNPGIEIEADEILEIEINNKNMTEAELENAQIMAASIVAAAAGSGFDTEEKQQKVPSAPIRVQDNVIEQVSVSNGQMEQTITDFTLPGVNGLDLVIARQYDSAKSNYFMPYGGILQNNQVAYLQYGFNSAIYRLNTGGTMEQTANEPTYSYQSWSFETENAYKQGAAYSFRLNAVETYTFTEPMGGNSQITNGSNISIRQYYTTSMTQNVDIAAGWRFCFSSVNKATKTVTLSDGREFNFSDPLLTSERSERLYSLLPYTWQDVQLDIRRNEYSVGGTGSTWVLYHANGTKEYFYDSGSLMAIVDKDGNAIEFTYQSVAGTTKRNCTIKDTMGRTIQIVNVATAQGYDVVVRYNNKDVMTYRTTSKSNIEAIGLSKATPNNNGFKAYVLSKAIDAEGNTTEYLYDDMGCAFSFMARWGNAVGGAIPNKNYAALNMLLNVDTNYYAVLKEVRYPTGLVSKYDYCQRQTDWCDYGAIRKPRLRFRYDEMSGARSNYKEYKYSYLAHTQENPPGNAGAYTYPAPTNTGVINHVSYPNSTVYGANVYWEYVMGHGDDGGGYEVYEHDYDRGLTTVYKIKNNDWSKMTEKIYINSTASGLGTLVERKIFGTSHGRPVSITTTHYSANGAQTLTIDERYAYNGFGAPKTIRINEKETLITYYNDGLTSTSYLSIPTMKRYNRDDGIAVRETNYLTYDGKNIGIVYIYENGIIQERIEYTYDSKGNMTELQKYTDPNTSSYVQTEYTYAASGGAPKSGLLSAVKVTGVKDSEGAARPDVVTSYEYDVYGRVTKTTNPLGTQTTYKYNALGDVTEIGYPAISGTVGFVYDYAGNVVTQTDILGTRTYYKYDPAGNLKLIRDEQTGNVLSAYEYDGAYRMTQKANYQSDQGAGIETYVYDSLDHLTDYQVKSPGGASLYRESYAYNYAIEGKYDVVTKTVHGDANAPSVVTKEYYDKDGFLAKVGYFPSGTEKTDVYTYDYLGSVKQLRTALDADRGLSYTVKYDLDYAGRPVREYNALGDYASTVYNGLGQVVSSTDFKGAVTTYAYDALGRLLTQTAPFEDSYTSVKKYDYDAAGNVTRERMSNNAPGAAASFAQTGYEYDGMGRLVKVTNYEQANPAQYTQYYYDKAGNVLRMYTGLSAALTIKGLDSVTGGAGGYSTTKYEYDHLGKLLAMTDPMGQSETYTYSVNGAVKTKTDRNGAVTTYVYDALGRPLGTTVTKDGVTTAQVGYTYTATGAKRTESNSNLTVTFTYDAAGRLVKESDNRGAEKTYTYNTAGSRTGLTYRQNGTAQQTLTYEYDSINRLSKVKENGAEKAAYTYDLNGNRATLTYAGTGLVESYAYNLANLVTSVTNKSGGTTLSSYSYTYYLDGNQRTKTDHTGKVTTYTYDGLGRLTQEAEAGGQTLSYTFDKAGNRATMTAAGTESYAVAYTYDKNNRLLTTEKTLADATEKTTYRYDPNGNTLSKLTETLSPAGGASALGFGGGGYELYSYDGFNRMTKSLTDGAETSYTYKPDGLRLSKTTDGVETRHVWDGANIIADLTNGTVTGKYVRGINLIYADLGGTAQYYLYNAHGDVVQLASGSGAVVKNYEYDAFGNEKNPQDGDVNPWRYCGEYWDLETNTYYLRARNYDPTTSRMLSEDSVRYVTRKMPNGQEIIDPLSLNLYTYCANNPIMYHDPSGNFWETVLDVLGIGWSAVDMWNDPSWANLGFLLWDVGATVLPFVPGSYTAKGGKLLVKAAGKADDVVDAFKALSKADRLAAVGGGNLIMNFKDLKKVAKGLGLEVHHLIEKRFAEKLGLKANDILSIAIDKDTHKQITKLMREKIPYDSLFAKGTTTSSASIQKVWDATRDVYKQLNLTEYLDPLKQQMIDAGHNLNWGKW